MTVLSDLRGSRELLTNLTMREVRGKYKRTALGQAWSLVTPLTTMLIYTVVFALFLRIDPPVGDPSGLNSYALWLVCGLLPFNFFSAALVGGMGSLLSNANLVNKVYFRREILVTSSVLAVLVTLFTELTVLVVVILAFGGMPLPYLPLVALAAVVLMLFTLGLALALSVANVYFRDTQHFVSILVQILFYATPILYPLSLVEKAAQRFQDSGRTLLGWDVPIMTIYQLNPLERFLSVFRAMLYDNRLPELGDVVFCLVATGLSLAIGRWTFMRYEGRLAEEL